MGDAGLGGESYDEWTIVGEDYYARFELYAYDWSQRLAYSRAFGGPAGAPLAVVRDDSKVMLYVDGAATPDVHIYSGSGRQLGTVLWGRSRLLAAGWTPEEELLSLDSQGVLRRHTPQGEPSAAACSFGAEVERLGADRAAVQGHAAALLTRSGSLWAVADVRDPRPQQLFLDGASLQARWSARGGVRAEGSDSSTSQTGAGDSLSAQLASRWGGAGRGSKPPGGGGQISASKRAPEVHAFAVLPPPPGLPQQLELLVAVDRGLALVDAADTLAFGMEATPAGCPDTSRSSEEPPPSLRGPFSALALSADGELVAAAGPQGEVWAWSRDGLRVLARWEVGEAAASLAETLGVESPPETPPEDVAWCGRDAVALRWEGVGLLLCTLPRDKGQAKGRAVEKSTRGVGCSPKSPALYPTGACRWLPYGEPGTALVSELDGLRIFRDSGHLLLRRVPEALRRTLEIGSTDPAALLFDARRLFEAADARAAGELLHVLRRGQLPAAVRTCLEAAGAELGREKQEALLRAACYGRAFCALADEAGEGKVPRGGKEHEAEKKKENSDRLDALAVARALRLLRALRDESVGMALTLAQLERSRPAAVAARLVARRRFLLALRVARAEGLSGGPCLTAWASAFLSGPGARLPDAELLQALEQRLERERDASWADIARLALEAGRPGLAARALEHEPRLWRRVPLLLELGHDEAALSSAVGGGDADLILAVVHAAIARRRPTAAGARELPSQAAGAAFSLTLGASPPALAALVRLERLRGSGALAAALEAAGRGEEAADEVLQDALVSMGRGEMEETAFKTQLLHARDLYARAPALAAKALKAQPQAALAPSPYVFAAAPSSAAAALGALSSQASAAAAAQAAAAAAAAEGAKVAAGVAGAAARLREAQLELQQSARREGLVGLAVAPTVLQCLKLGLVDAAQKIAREFKLADAHMQQLHLDAVAAQQDWVHLQTMVARLDRKSLLTVEHFIRTARAHNAPDDILRWLVDRIQGENAVQRRAKMLSELGHEAEARALLSQQSTAGRMGAEGGVLGSLRDTLTGGMGSLFQRVGAPRG